MKLITFAGIVLIALVVISLTSCSPVPYGNVGANVPMLKNPGEVNLNLSYGATEDAEGFAFQGAAVIDSGWAVLGSYYNLGSLADSDWKGRGNLGELGLGRYFGSGEQKFIGDVFLGVGFGGIKNNYNDLSLRVKFTKPFLQGSIGFSHKIVDVAFSSRFTVIHYTDHEFRLTDPVQAQEASAFFEENRTTFAYEPAITVRVGYKNIRFSAQYCYSTFSVDENRFPNTYINQDYFGIGANILIGKRWE